MPEIDIDLCKGCGICVSICPKKVFSISKKQNKSGYMVPEPSKLSSCTHCGLCELTCPDFAINLGNIKSKRIPKPDRKKGERC